MVIPGAPVRSAGVGGFTGAGGMGTVPSGPKPKERVWGKRSGNANDVPINAPDGPRNGGFGNGPQGYGSAPDFIKGAPTGGERDEDKDDDELERERVAERKRAEDESFRDVNVSLDILIDQTLTKHSPCFSSANVVGRTENECELATSSGQ